MQSIHKFLTFTPKIEHNLEHDSKVLPLFSSPKIYTAKGDLSKRWYLYFSFRNPKTGKLKRMANIYGKVNHYKTKEARMSVLSSYRKNLLFLLNQGFNPFLENTELYEQLKNSIKEREKEKGVKKEIKKDAISSAISKAIKVAIKEALVDKTIVVKEQNIAMGEENIASKDKNIATKDENIASKKQNIASNDKNIANEKQNIATGEENIASNDKNIANEKKDVQGLTIRQAFDFALDLKEKEVNDRTIRDYRRKIYLFINSMNESYPKKKYIREVSRKDLVDYLNGIVLKTSARSRNNYRTEL